MTINITIDLDDFEIPNLEQVKNLKELVDQINQNYARRSDIKSRHNEQFIDIHNENWVARPLADIPAATWDAEEECMTPGEGEVQLMRCESDKRKDHFRTEQVRNLCSEVIPASTLNVCGDPVEVTGTQTVMIDAECTQVCITGTVTGNGSVTVESGANSIVLMEGDANVCIDLDGDVDVTSTNATFNLTLQGQSEIPNFVIILQDTQCCEWWVIPCGGGSETNCASIQAAHGYPDAMEPAHLLENSVWASVFRVVDGIPMCQVCRILKCGDELPPSVAMPVFDIPFTPPSENGFIGDDDYGEPVRVNKQ